jgi:hypothetical protein
MRVARPILFVSLLPCLFATACRVAKSDLPGEYYYVSDDGSESPALDLGDDGSYTLYRSFYSDPNAPGTIQVVGKGQIYEHSGSGTWEVLNGSIAGPGDEAVQFTGRGGGQVYVDAMAVKQKDGRICLYTDGKKEYWCKKK